MTVFSVCVRLTVTACPSLAVPEKVPPKRGDGERSSRSHPLTIATRNAATINPAVAPVFRIDFPKTGQFLEIVLISPVSSRQSRSQLNSHEQPETWNR
jgi:hypothetical protein